MRLVDYSGTLHHYIIIHMYVISALGTASNQSVECEDMQYKVMYIHTTQLLKHCLKGIVSQINHMYIHELSHTIIMDTCKSMTKRCISDIHVYTCQSSEAGIQGDRCTCTPGIHRHTPIVRGSI